MKQIMLFISITMTLTFSANVYAGCDQRAQQYVDNFCRGVRSCEFRGNINQLPPGYIGEFDGIFVENPYEEYAHLYRIADGNQVVGYLVIDYTCYESRLFQ